jgi:hypothetical protein
MKTLYAPNGTRVYTREDVQRIGKTMVSLGTTEYAADYAAPVGGSAPPGLNFTFGDSFKRTQEGSMEFAIPTSQIPVINEALRFACENVFVAKALRLRTVFTCAGITNENNSSETNDFLDKVMTNLNLENLYRQCVWMYWAAGLVPLLMPEENEPFTWIELVDPRQIRFQKSFGKTIMFLRPNKLMVACARDQVGQTDPMHKALWNSYPKSWQKQLNAYLKQNRAESDWIINLDPSSYIVIENRDMPFSRGEANFDGSPLQPYFAAALQYRQLMAGDFAASFVAKNLIALVSIGDPKTEGDRYQRPDRNALLKLQAAFGNPNSAQWSYVDPTVNVRYITPEPNIFQSQKYDDVKEQLKELLPSPFWYNNGTGSFAGASSELTWLQQEIDHCHDAFDRNFWMPIFKRAMANQARLAPNKVKPPSHHKSNLKDNNQWLSTLSGLYANGGLDINTLISEHGFDPEKITENLKGQASDVKAGVYMPAFEQKQGIVADKLGVNDKPDGQAPPNKGVGKKPNGRPSVPGSKPQSETSKNRTPRPDKTSKS